MTATRCIDVKLWRRAVLASSMPMSGKVAAFGLHESMRWAASDPDAGRCWPGLRTLAEDCGMDRRSLIRSLALVEDFGFIERACRRGCDDCQGGNGHSTVYTATLPERWHVVTANGDTVTPPAVTPAVTTVRLSGDNGASQRWHGVTGTEKNVEGTEELAREPAAAAAVCTECNGSGWQLDEDERAGACQACQPDRVLPKPLEVRGDPDQLDQVLGEVRP